MVMIRYNNFQDYGMHQYLYENLVDVRTIVEDKKQSFTLINDGFTGSGKTTLSIQEAVFLARGDRRKFNLGHVLFDPEKAFEKVSNSKKGDVWIFDESVVFNSRSAMSQYNKAMLMLLSTIRNKQIYIILNIPSFFDLDRAITMDKAHMLVHLYGEHFGDRGKFLVFDQGRMKDLFIKGKKTYSYKLVPANFPGNFGGKFLLDENAYDKRKAKEIKKIFMAGTKGSQVRWQRDMFMIYLNQRYKVPYRKLAELLPNEIALAKNTMSAAKERIRNKYNPEWFKKRKIEEIGEKEESEDIHQNLNN